MPNVHSHDMNKYTPMKIQRAKIKYGNSLYLPKKSGQALYLPRRLSQHGDGFAEILENIKAATEVGKNIVEAGKSVADLVNKFKSKKKPDISEEALANILNAREHKMEKHGQGFFYINDHDRS